MKHVCPYCDLPMEEGYSIVHVYTWIFNRLLDYFFGWAYLGLFFKTNDNKFIRIQKPLAVRNALRCNTCESFIILGEKSIVTNKMESSRKLERVKNEVVTLFKFVAEAENLDYSTAGFHGSNIIESLHGRWKIILQSNQQQIEEYYDQEVMELFTKFGSELNSFHGKLKSTPISDQAVFHLELWQKLRKLAEEILTRL